MIKFDADSIYNNLLKRMQQDPSWKAISNGSVITALLQSNAEVNAETARYAEYLFRESKWDTAQNPSSIVAMANMLGYKPKRKVSASGTLKLSLDPRIHTIGQSRGGFSEELFKASGSEQLELMQWAKPSADIKITSNSRIIDSNGNSYIASPSTFPANSYFSDVNIIQGIKKSVFIDINTIRDVSRVTKLDPYRYVPITIENCENADTLTSKAYFEVILKKRFGSEEYRIVDTLMFSKKGDRDVEVYNDLYNQNLFYLKFVNDSSRGTVLDLSKNTDLEGIQVNYVESLGAAGNIATAYQNFTITNVFTTNEFGSREVKLYGINTSGILGGADEEPSSEIKERAPKYYMKSYTAGTKEAYENTISNLKFSIKVDSEKSDMLELEPRKVRVYGGTVETSSAAGQTVLQPVTYITFLSKNLEDISTELNETAYKEIEESLNYYLERLKSPQDTLKFVAPSYVPFALGINCRVKKDSQVDITQLTNDIRETIINQWGPNAADQDFNRNFYTSTIINTILEKYPAVESIGSDIEVEAVDQVKWKNASRINSNAGSVDSKKVHVIRVPYSFNSLFLGNKTIKGFKDSRSGAKCVMRIDFMYKHPSAMPVNRAFHTSIFIQDDQGSKGVSNSSSEASPFYLLNDASTVSGSGTWSKDIFDPEAISDPEYSVFKDKNRPIRKLETSKQFYFKDKLYGDNDYEALIKQSEQDSEELLSNHLLTPGAVDEYLVYYSPSQSDSRKAINSAKGWIEIGFDSIYDLLERFSIYDYNLRSSLEKCSLARLKCGEAGEADFEIFKQILNDYVDVYVSMRPNDTDLVTSQMKDDLGGTILYIDSSDINSTSRGNVAVSNLSSHKRLRMVSVNCTQSDN